MRLIDETPRPGAEGALVAFIHPSAAHGVLVELKQPAVGARAGQPATVPLFRTPVRHALGDLELITLSDGFFAPRRRGDVRRRAAHAVGDSGCRPTTAIASRSACGR